MALINTIPDPPWSSPVGPNAVELFEFDMSEWLQTSTIYGTPTATATNFVAATNPLVQDISVSGQVVSVWLVSPGWTAGVQYTLTVHAVASDGREEDFSVRMWCGLH